MRLEDLFSTLGTIAGTIGSQIQQEACEGVPLEDLDLTGPAPREIALRSPARVVVSEGEVFRVDVDPGFRTEGVRFTLDDERLAITGGGRQTLVRVTMRAPDRLAVAGSGHMTAEKLGRDGELSIAGSGRIEISAAQGRQIRADIAGSGSLVVDGHADTFALSIAGSGSCDAEGLVVDRADIHIAGSGDAIFACNGEVSAHMVGSGNVIVLGSARCSVHSIGSGTVTCERERETAD